MEKLTSTANPMVKKTKALLDAKNRRAEKAFVVEGEVMIKEALSCGLTPLYALSEYATDIVPEVRLCSRAVLEACSDTKTPQGICSVFALPEERKLNPAARRIIALDGVQDPGNVGTILRTADAAGFEGVLLDNRCPEVFSPKVQRSAMGSAFRMPVWRGRLYDELVRRKTDGGKIVVSALEGAVDYRSVRFDANAPLILVIGNEAQGVTPEVKALANVTLKIPMRGRAESLNAAVAAGILMYALTEVN